MRYIAPLIALTLGTVFALCASQQPSTVRPTPMYYELYSWQDSGGSEWSFSILYNTNRNKTVKEVFSKKTALRGLDQLKVKVSDIPKGSHIVWLDELTFNGVKVKGSESLKYPPEAVVSEVRRYAQARGIEVVGPATSSAP